MARIRRRGRRRGRPRRGARGWGRARRRAPASSRRPAGTSRVSAVAPGADTACPAIRPGTAARARWRSRRGRRLEHRSCVSRRLLRRRSANGPHDDVELRLEEGTNRGSRASRGVEVERRPAGRPPATRAKRPPRLVAAGAVASPTEATAAAPGREHSSEISPEVQLVGREVRVGRVVPVDGADRRIRKSTQPQPYGCSPCLCGSTTIESASPTASKARARVRRPDSPPA